MVAATGVRRMSPKCASSRASCADLGAEVQLDLARLFGLRGECSLRQQRGREHRILGQRGDDDGGFGGAVDARARHAPARERAA